MTAPEVGQPLAPRATALEHCGRVRFLARQGWLDAIQIDVGVPSLGYSGPEWPVTDGNHRLWASILRGEAFIPSISVGRSITRLCSWVFQKR